MILDIVAKGASDVSVRIKIIDATDGSPETAVEHNSAGIDLWYRREGAAQTSITEAALAALTTAHTDGGIEHIGDGYYRLDLPDAAFAVGARYVEVGGTVTGMIVIGGVVLLTDVDLNDGVRGGLTALPNAAADAAGGLPISDGGGLDMDAILADTNELQTDWANGGRLDLLIDAIKAATDNLPADPADASDIATAFAALNDLDAAGVRAAVGLSAADLDTQLGAIDTVVAAVKVVTDALTAAAAAKLAKTMSTIAEGTVEDTTTTPTTTDFAAPDITEATADHFIGRTVVWVAGALTLQAAIITDYELSGGAGKFTVETMTEAPADGDTFIIV